METKGIIELLQKSKKIFVTFHDWKNTKFGKRPCFLIFAEIDNQISEIIDKNHPYWDKKKNAYSITTIGVNNVNELLSYFISFAYHLYGEEFASKFQKELLAKTYKLFKD